MACKRPRCSSSVALRGVLFELCLALADLFLQGRIQQVLLFFLQTQNPLLLLDMLLLQTLQAGAFHLGTARRFGGILVELRPRRLPFMHGLLGLEQGCTGDFLTLLCFLQLRAQDLQSASARSASARSRSCCRRRSRVC